ncbi:MAG: hypothetical protein HY459_01165, partial [Parcubacteria group bacterium]|nr:hypothetical protein [Parcubacteria group bacterium]
MAALVLVLIWKTLLRRGLISRSLNLVLLAIRFPTPAPSPQEPSLQQVREKIGLMEQLLSQLAVIRDKWWRSLLYGRPQFVLELAIPSIGEEMTFYIAVPRRRVLAIEKIIQGVFPESHIEESRDYNIFNPSGSVLSSFVQLK